MAEENEDGQEKTEDPTERRLEKGREDGQVARSKELATMLSLLFGVFGLYFAGIMLAEAMEQIAREAFTFDRGSLQDKHGMLSFLGDSARKIIFPIVIVGAAGMVAAIIGGIGIGGFNFAPKALAPKLDRISFFKGLKRIFSMTSIVEFVKSVLKVVLIAGIGYFALLNQIDELRALADKDIETAIAEGLMIIFWIVVLMTLGLVLVAAIDIPYQIYDHNKKMRMTMKEMKDEFKETEGSPELKGKVRQMQREMSNRRMMEAIPEADVVITNPTHYSVAVKYEADRGGAPVVVAKGKNDVALKIKEIAQQHKIPRLETPPLARAIYHSTRIDEEIPPGLYHAVAQVLAYVFQLNQHFQGKGAMPDRLGALPIPSDLQVDPD